MAAIPGKEGVSLQIARQKLASREDSVALGHAQALFTLIENSASYATGTNKAQSESLRRYIPLRLGDSILDRGRRNSQAQPSESEAINQGVNYVLEALGLPLEITADRAKARKEQQNLLWDKRGQEPQLLRSEFLDATESRSVEKYILLPSNEDGIFMVYAQGLHKNFVPIGTFVPSPGNREAIAHIVPSWEMTA